MKHMQIPRTPKNMAKALRRSGLPDSFIRNFDKLLQAGDLIAPDAGTGTGPAVETRELMETLIEAGKKAGIDPVLLHALGKTGRILSEDNICFLSEEEVQEWADAIEEGRRIYGHESTRGW